MRCGAGGSDLAMAMMKEGPMFSEAGSGDTKALANDAGDFVIDGDLRVNRSGFGAMRITGKGIWRPPADKGEAIRVLKRAVELGINFIDTADSYGPYVSEELIAEALYPYADGLIIGTKGGLTRTGPDQWPVNASPEHLKDALEGSLKRLKLDQIDLNAQGWH